MSIQLLKRQIKEYIGTNEIDEAISTLQKRGSDWLQQYGAKSWPMVEVSSSLADVYMSCGATCDKEADAAVLYEKAALVRRDVTSERDPEYASLIEKAADAFFKIAEYKRALNHYKHLVKKVRAGLGEGHEAVRIVQRKLGDCAMKSGNYNIAAKTFQKILDGHLAGDDEVHARVSLSVAQAKLGRHMEALENAESAKQSAKKHFGSSDFHYAKALNSVAGVLERLGRDAEALRLMEEASDVVQNSMGRQDPVSIQARRNVEGMRSFIRAKQSKYG